MAAGDGVAGVLQDVGNEVDIAVQPDSICPSDKIDLQRGHRHSGSRVTMRGGLGNGNFGEVKMEMPCFPEWVALHSGVLASSSDWLRDRKIIHRNDANGGLLVKLGDGEVAKVFPDKGRLVGWFRIMLGKTKAHKQFSSMQALERVGVLTPKPLRVVSFKPGDGEFEGALIYEFVEGVVEAREALEGELRGKVLDGLARDLIKMARGGVLFVDLHLGNVLVDDEGDLCWIDVEVREGGGLVKSQFWSRVVRLHRKCDPGVLSDDEWRMLCETLSAELPGFKDEPSFPA